MGNIKHVTYKVYDGDNLVLDRVTVDIIADYTGKSITHIRKSVRLGSLLGKRYRVYKCEPNKEPEKTEGSLNKLFPKSLLDEWEDMRAVAQIIKDRRDKRLGKE